MNNFQAKKVLYSEGFSDVDKACLKVENNLRRIEEIPPKYRNIFENYSHFNSVQSKVFDDVFRTTKSIIVSAPTGSGKTVIFELAMIHLLMNLPEETNFKIVYVAPIKALCSEKYFDWSKKFNPLGISCREVTGDSDISDFNELTHTNLIITTPEKWDSLTRKWRDNEDFVGAIRLFLIDEVHLLNEDIRGPILETIVSRMKTIQFSMKMKKKNEINLRFVAASATIPNIEDLATWLGGKDNRISYFQISEEQRPVKLEKYILGFNSNASGFKFDMSLNYKLGGIIRKYSAGKPTLIFCSSRKSVEMASTVLLQDSPVIPLSDNHKTALVKISRKLQNNKLQGLVLKAIAFHHAGLGHDDRNLIEEAFRHSLVLILVSTNTLAMGVNLPAHLVVIKSTEAFARGAVIEYSQSSILQMIGRAGRPQYDVKGVAVIMTQQKNVKKYEHLMNGCTPVESHLHKHLAEHLNSEIVLQTITDLEVAMEWIRSTFLYVRAVKCPANYGLSPGLTREQVEKKLEEMCLIQINALETHGLIIKDQAFGLSVAATQYGRLMARYYISFDTMKTFRKFRGDESFLDILNLIISSKEFSEFTIRVNDKKTLNSLNSQSIRFPIKGKVKSLENKVSCLIQAVLGNITIPEPSLVQDSLRMTRQGERVAKCLVEYIRLSENRLNRSIFKALLNAVIITKCLKAKLWENSKYVCKQLKKIGAVYSNLLFSAGKTSLQSLMETDARTLEMILNKPPPFGSDIHEGLAAFPEYSLELKLKAPGVGKVVVKQIKEAYQFDGKNSTLIIGDTNNNLILFNDKVDFVIEEDGIFERDFKIPDCLAQGIGAHLVHEILVGIDKEASLILNPLDDFESSKKSRRKVQSKSKVPRSTNKLRKVSASEKNPKCTSHTTGDNYVSLLEDDEYFHDLEISNEIILVEGDEIVKNAETTKQIIQKYQTVEAPLKRKLDNFEYVERSKINKVLVEQDNLLEIFDDGFEDSIKECDLFEEEVNKSKSEIDNLDNCSSDVIYVNDDPKSTQKIVLSIKCKQNEKENKLPQQHVNNKKLACAISKPKKKIISDYFIKGSAKTAQESSTFLPRQLKFDKPPYDRLQEIPRQLQQARQNTFDEIGSYLSQKELQSRHVDSTSIPKNTPHSSDIPLNRIELDLSAAEMSEVGNNTNVSTERQTKAPCHLHTHIYEENVIMEDNLKYNIQSNNAEAEKLPKTTCQNNLTKQNQLSDDYEKNSKNNKSQNLSLKEFISNPIRSGNVYHNTKRHDEFTSGFLSNNRCEQIKMNLRTKVDTKLCPKPSFLITKDEDQSMFSNILTCGTNSEQHKLNKFNQMNMYLDEAPLNLCRKDNEALDLSKKREIHTSTSNPEQIINCNKEINIPQIENEYQPLELVRKSISKICSQVKGSATSIQTDLSGPTCISNYSSAPRFEVEVKHLSNTSSDQLKTIERRSHHSDTSEPVMIQSQNHLQSNQKKEKNQELIDYEGKLNVSSSKSLQSDYDKSEELSTFQDLLECSDYFEDEFSFESITKYDPLAENEIGKKLCNKKDDDNNTVRNKENLHKLPSMVDKRNEVRRSEDFEYKNQVPLNDYVHLKSIENICSNEELFFKLDNRSTSKGEQIKYYKKCHTPESRLLDKSCFRCESYSNRKFTEEVKENSAFLEDFIPKNKENSNKRQNIISENWFRTPKPTSGVSLNERRSTCKSLTLHNIGEEPRDISNKSSFETKIEKNGNHFCNKFLRNGPPMKPGNIFTPFKRCPVTEPFFNKRFTDTLKNNFVKSTSGMKVESENKITDNNNCNNTRSASNSTIAVENTKSGDESSNEAVKNSVRLENNLVEIQKEKEYSHKDNAKENEVNQSTEGNSNPIEESNQFNCGIFSNVPNVSEITSAFKKQPQTQKISDILRSICDNKLSKDLTECEIPDNVFQIVVIDDTAEAENITSTAGDFLAENNSDKKFVYCKDLVLETKFVAGQIARLPDINDNTITRPVSSKNTSNEILNSSIAAPSFLNPTSRLNPYRLKIPRRQKSFLIQKLELKNEPARKKIIEVDALSKSLNRKFKNNSNCDEKSFMMEPTPLKLADENRIVCSENYYKNGDVHLDALSNWSPRTEKPTFGVAYGDPILKERSLDYDDVPIKCSPDSDDCSDFASVFSQNLSGAESIFNNERKEDKIYAADWEI